MMRKRWILLVVAGLVGVGSITWSAMASNVETPSYAVSSKSGNLEIREYGPTIVAEATVAGERDKAIQRGFRIIADYIFGNNLSSTKVAMTAPVMQQSSEKIAMTAPVIQQASGKSWNVRFVMPSKYTMETLPKPVNPKVALIEVPAMRFAAIRFSGFAGQGSLDKHEAQLRAFMAERGLTATSEPQYAFYNAPWTLPFMRRNEVMIEAADTSG
ncbi:heme-binding protein [Sphingorhabdus sp. EL138]|uniref:SOUL family heme-binding protein n=1 Tax=Sphingorhabdus sp. EL138 TaxID=2073156 RepID=UPI0025D3EE28|nr:heme-binding protein [Sphingorhabdus sp. EL138]